MADSSFMIDAMRLRQAVGILGGSSFCDRYDDPTKRTEQKEKKKKTPIKSQKRGLRKKS